MQQVLNVDKALHIYRCRGFNKSVPFIRILEPFEQLTKAFLRHHKSRARLRCELSIVRAHHSKPSMVAVFIKFSGYVSQLFVAPFRLNKPTTRTYVCYYTTLTSGASCICNPCNHTTNNMRKDQTLQPMVIPTRTCLFCHF